MSKRTDLAAPSVIDPAAFAFVAGVYFGHNSDEGFQEFLSEWMADQCAGGEPSWLSDKSAVIETYPPLDPQGNFVRKGTCDHCGARFDWGSIYRHTSGLHIVVGNVCADKTMSVPSRLELDVKRLKAQIKARAESIRAKESAHAQAVEGGFAWLYDVTQTHYILADVARKGLQYGSLTPRQIELVQRLRADQPARESREAERAAQDAAADPVPVTTERVAIRGEVLTVRTQEGYMGLPVEKMLVRVDAGYKLWGSVPSNLNVNQGDKVEFQAAIERSQKDAKFGFFTRPTKAKITQSTK